MAAEDASLPPPACFMACCLFGDGVLWPMDLFIASSALFVWPLTCAGLFWDVLKEHVVAKPTGRLGIILAELVDQKTSRARRPRVLDEAIVIRSHFPPLRSFESGEALGRIWLLASQ